VVGEALVGVHHAREINTGGIVIDECRVGCLRQDNGEGRRGNHICVPCRAGSLNIVVEGVFCVNCSGKFADLLTADNVGVLGRVDPAHNLRVNAHGFSLPFLCTVFSLGAQSGRRINDSERTRAVFLRIIYLLAKARNMPLHFSPRRE